MTPAALLDGYRDRSCARQWRGFLRAMAAEFDQALPEEESARLMARIGQRFADAHVLPPVATVEALQASVNAVWADCEWGWAAFEERADQLRIVHAGSPLAVALGQGGGWHHGFLEGAYRHWLRGAGMLAVLDVRHLATADRDVSTFTVARVF
ncbi:cellulose biosynthesis protein BcsD [Stenotrophomonas nitritireducens]|uniref:cellulose biosynthesis protein BcsD n=1 Tax=Stenotrophomonas nitritireducens TaxID=83617 RepID=UPI003D97020F